MRYIDKSHENIFFTFLKGIIKYSNYNIALINDYYIAFIIPLRAIENIKTNQAFKKF